MTAKKARNGEVVSSSNLHLSLISNGDFEHLTPFFLHFSYDRYFKKKAEGCDFWLSTCLKDPRSKEKPIPMHFAFIHINSFEKRDLSYLDYLQKIILNESKVVCPRYMTPVSLPSFSPDQLLLVYGLL